MSGTQFTSFRSPNLSEWLSGRGETVPAGKSGVVYTCARTWDGSVFSLEPSLTNPNLVLEGPHIRALAAIGAGGSQTAAVWERQPETSVEYLVTLTGPWPKLNPHHTGRRLRRTSVVESVKAQGDKNLTIEGGNIVAADQIAAGVVQRAIVREVQGDRTHEYLVAIPGPAGPGVVVPLKPTMTGSVFQLLVWSTDDNLVIDAPQGNLIQIIPLEAIPARAVQRVIVRETSGGCGIRYAVTITAKG